MSLFIFEVFHKTFISVHEEGTEAAAATAVVAGTTSAPVVEEEVVIDRPFLFFIRDKKTGAILFLGRERRGSHRHMSMRRCATSPTPLLGHTTG